MGCSAARRSVFPDQVEGEEPAALRYADNGANIVGMTILTQEATIKNKADLVRRFVKATARSWEEAKKNPEAAVDATMKVKPDLNRGRARPAQGGHRADGIENSKGRTGWGAQNDWEQTLALLKHTAT